MHVVRGRPEIVGRHGAGRGPLYRRAAHGRPGPTRCQTRQVAQNDALGVQGPVPGRPRQKAFQRFQAERAVGRRHSPASGRCPLLCTRLLGVGLCGFHHRRVLPEDHRLADHLPASAHRPGPGRPREWPSGSGNVRGLISLAWCTTCDRGARYRSRPLRGRPWPRPRRSPRWGRRGDSFRLRPGRGSELAVQGRADP